MSEPKPNPTSTDELATALLVAWDRCDPRRRAELRRACAGGIEALLAQIGPRALLAMLDD